MIGNVVKCARVDCGKEFTKITHNNKYCSTICCRTETNRKLMVEYHKREAIKRGLKRACKDCGTSLSRYNASEVCGGCQTKRRNVHEGEASNLLASVNWL